MTEELKKTITRYRIDDLAEELETNYVSKSRRKDIIKFFHKHLGDGPYYAVCYYNDGMKAIERSGYLGELAKNYKCSTSNSSYSLEAVNGSIEGGEKHPMIVQEINPKTTFEFYNFDRYTVYYINDEFVKE